MRYIAMPRGGVKTLMSKFGTSAVTVWSALTYRTSSELAERIRETALGMGGEFACVVRTKGFIPNCEIRYERDERGAVAKMVQTWANGVTLVTDVLHDTAVLYQGGEVVAGWSGVTISMWADAAFEAQKYSES